MDTAVICAITLGLISGVSEGAGVLPDDSLNAALGGSVIFNTTLSPPGTPFLSVIWTVGVKEIMTSAISNFTGPEYEGRITLFRSTGSLELRNLTLSDSGEYRVSIIPADGRSQSGHTRLEIHERISGASVKSSTNQSVEGNSVNLTCEASGTIFTRKWRKDGSDLILNDNMILYNNNRVLSFQPLKRPDRGEYSCDISNPVSSEEAKYNMVVNYGPENVQIKGPREITLTHTLKLNCSADSTPTAIYTWKLNDTEILSNSAVFTKNITGLSDSGNYTCEATNHVTGRTSSAVHGLSVTVGKTPGGLSAGAIAAITIVTCFIVAVGAAGGYWIFKKKTNKNHQPHKTEPEDNLYEDMSVIYENIK